jgi:hypothetical protein
VRLAKDKTKIRDLILFLTRPDPQTCPHLLSTRFDLHPIGTRIGNIFPPLCCVGPTCQLSDSSPNPQSLPYSTRGPLAMNPAGREVPHASGWPASSACPSAWPRRPLEVGTATPYAGQHLPPAVRSICRCCQREAHLFGQAATGQQPPLDRRGL